MKMAEEDGAAVGLLTDFLCGVMFVCLPAYSSGFIWEGAELMGPYNGCPPIQGAMALRASFIMRCSITAERREDSTSFQIDFLPTGQRWVWFRPCRYQDEEDHP